MASIRLKGVTKSYSNDDRQVVRDVDLDIAEGEFVVLLGPSGCGKTTTLRLIAGLEKPSSGTIYFDDVVVNDLPGSQRKVGMVFQNYALYPHMSVFENLAFGLQSRGVSRSEASQRVNEVLALLELDGLQSRRPRELSGGQRQRVALGRALVGRPSVFLMDEPLSNLDANLREQMRIELGLLHKRLGITTVYVTHDQSEAMTLADRIVIMDQGQIRQVAEPSVMYSSPIDTFVAKFVGSPGTNLVTLPWLLDEQGIACGDAVRLPIALNGLLLQSGPESVVVLGFRPERLQVEEIEDGACLRCIVDLVEHLGSHIQCHLHLDSQVSEQRMIAKLPGEADIRPGQAIRLYCPLPDVRAFHHESGRSLMQGGDLLETFPSKSATDFVQSYDLCADAVVRHGNERA